MGRGGAWGMMGGSWVMEFLSEIVYIWVGFVWNRGFWCIFRWILRGAVYSIHRGYILVSTFVNDILPCKTSAVFRLVGLDLLYVLRLFVCLCSEVGGSLALEWKSFWSERWEWVGSGLGWGRDRVGGGCGFGGRSGGVEGEGKARGGKIARVVLAGLPPRIRKLYTTVYSCYLSIPGNIGMRGMRGMRRVLIMVYLCFQ